MGWWHPIWRTHRFHNAPTAVSIVRVDLAFGASPWYGCQYPLWPKSYSFDLHFQIIKMFYHLNRNPLEFRVHNDRQGCVVAFAYWSNELLWQKLAPNLIPTVSILGDKSFVGSSLGTVRCSASGFKFYVEPSLGIGLVFPNDFGRCLKELMRRSKL